MMRFCADTATSCKVHTTAADVGMAHSAPRTGEGVGLGRESEPPLPFYDVDQDLMDDLAEWTSMPPLETWPVTIRLEHLGAAESPFYDLPEEDE
jgi:hypothetical protein